jgi:hypothetical protein
MKMGVDILKLIYVSFPINYNNYEYDEEIVDKYFVKGVNMCLNSLISIHLKYK